MLCHRRRCRQWRRIGDRSGRRHGRRRHGDDNDAVDAVVPPSSTKDEDAYVGELVAFERCSHAFKRCSHAFERCSHRAAAVALCATAALWLRR